MESQGQTEPEISPKLGVNILKENVAALDGMISILVLTDISKTYPFCLSSGGSGLTLIDEIGRGSYGVVHKALWRGSVVAAKVLSIPTYTSAQSARNEAEILRCAVYLFGQLRNNNTVISIVIYTILTLFL